jgi:branched-chain amino acid transport system permease protein
MRRKYTCGILTLVLMAIFLVFPFFATKGWLHIFIAMLFNMLYSVGLWVIMRMGYLSFGHAAYIGIGGYASAMLTTMLKVPVFVSIPISGLIAAIIGFGIGKVTLKLRGIYFSITVFAFTEVMRALWLAFDKPFGGPSGIWNIPRPSLLGFTFSSHISFYFLMLFFFLLVFVFLWSLDRSHFGFTCLGVQTRETELLAQSVGIDTNFYKNISFSVSCLICGLAGAFYAHYFNFVSPFVFTFFLSTDLVVFNMVGGTATILGPIIGAGLLTVASELAFAAGYYRTLMFGIMLIVVILVLPGGIVSLFGKRR